MRRVTCDDQTVDERKVARAASLLPSDITSLAELFKAMGDETRCKIVCALMHEQLCVCEIARVVDSSISNISHHLRKLRAQRLVRSQRQGQRVIYSLDDAHVMTLIGEGIEHTKHN